MSLKKCNAFAMDPSYIAKFGIVIVRFSDIERNTDNHRCETTSLVLCTASLSLALTIFAFRLSLTNGKI